jgi:nucleotide-binding universal stress UspA family protein
MFTHVLIPTDGSELSDQAVQNGIGFARDAGARVTFLTVVEPFHVFTTDSVQLESTRADYLAHAERQAAATLARARAGAEAAGVAADTLQVVSDQPYAAIIDAAASRGCDLIAMASHGRRGLAAVVLGSQTLKVLTHSAVPVLVYR